MSTIFVHEHVAGGGLGERATSGALFDEGLAMLRAFVADLVACPGVDVVTTIDRRVAREARLATAARVVVVERSERIDDVVLELAKRSDRTLLIAPEIDSRLEELARAVTAIGAELLGGSVDAIRLASDKLLLAQHLLRAGVPTPSAECATAGKSWPEARVVKPRFGAGSIDIELVGAGSPTPPSGSERIATPFVDGVAASVLCLVASGRIVPCPACEQIVSRVRGFRYEGGLYPLAGSLEHPLARRARDLALAAVQSLPAPRGFFGVDLVLDAAHPERDCVIEINPRLTTSYCGLRERTRANLAGALLELLRGADVEIEWIDATLSFDARGTTGTTSGVTTNTACPWRPVRA